MATYSIKKTNNGEYKEIEKYLTLDYGKLGGHPDTLYFHADGEDLPLIFSINTFEDIMINQIQLGLMESLEYDNGVLITTTRDGNTIKRYYYDLFSKKSNHSAFGLNLENALDDLKRSIIKIVTFYNENPSRELLSQQKYINMIFDIMDGDRLPKIKDKDEILRVFQVYHAHKADILESLLDNVVFYDDAGNVLEYGKFLKTKKIEAIKYDVLNQMEIKMLMFAVNNEAYDLYQEYNSNVHIPRVEVEYKYVDQDGNEIEAPVEEVEAGTIFSVGRELVKRGVSNFKDAAVSGVTKVANNASAMVEMIKSKRRTK